MHKGFTLIEVLVVIGILVVLIGVSLTAFIKNSSKSNLDKEAKIILSYINNAREQTISSSDNSEYGVYFASTSVTVFKGKVYPASTSTIYEISAPSVSIFSFSLTGNTDRFYFKKITGEPSATGTIVIRNSANNMIQTITVKPTGIIQIQ